VDAADEERRAFVGLLAFAGLRLSEALAVVWGDVDLDGGVVQVRCQLEHGTLARVEPKTTAAVRDVEVGEDFVSILRAWKLRSRFSGPSNFVVTTASGAPLDQRGASRRLDWIVKQAGLDVEGFARITPHQLRYTYGSLLLEAGGQPATVSRLMGHTNIAITQGIYQHEIERRDSAERTPESVRQAFSRGTDSVTVVSRRGGQSRAIGRDGQDANVAWLGGFGDR